MDDGVRDTSQGATRTGASSLSAEPELKLRSDNSFRSIRGSFSVKGLAPVPLKEELVSPAKVSISLKQLNFIGTIGPESLDSLCRHFGQCSSNRFPRVKYIVPKTMPHDWVVPATQPRFCPAHSLLNRLNDGVGDGATDAMRHLGERLWNRKA